MPLSVPFASQSTATRFRRLARAGAAIILTAALTATAGCGFDVQTNQPYTPAEGINVDVGPRQQAVAVRNLVIVSKEPGSGYVSASLTAAAHTDALQRITGRAYTRDGQPGAPLTVNQPGPVQVPAGSLVVLTDQPLIEVTSADLEPGLEAEVTLTFATAGETTMRIPVVSADDPQFATVSPSPSASTSPTPQ